VDRLEWFLAHAAGEHAYSIAKKVQGHNATIPKR
jgi:hypothetical protein